MSLQSTLPIGTALLLGSLLWAAENGVPAAGALAQKKPIPPTGFQLFLGAENLLANRRWACNDSTDALQEVAGGLTALDGPTYLGDDNLEAGEVRFAGTLLVLARMVLGLGQGGVVNVVAQPGAGPEPQRWRGLRRVSFGVRNHHIIFEQWDGSRSTPVLAQSIEAKVAHGPIDLELRIQPGEFLLFLNGRLRGRTLSKPRRWLGRGQ